MKSVTVTTHANIALCKYWGKRDEQLLLPTKSSLAVNIAALSTTTTASFSMTSHDTIKTLWNNNDLEAKKKIAAFLQLLRNYFNLPYFFSIETKNNFSQKNGLASSASGFAALTLAVIHLCNINISEQELSCLARQGSGSACRSLRGGFVLWHRGNNLNGMDSYAEQIATDTYWPNFRIIIAQVSSVEKNISSRIGMSLSVQTAPLYNSWINASTERINKMITALNKRDIALLGALAEEDWHDMHTIMLTTIPSLDYWNNDSYSIMATIKNLRASGIPAYFTTDAGPNIKIFCLEENVSTIMTTLQKKVPTANYINSTIAPDPIVTLNE